MKIKSEIIYTDTIYYYKKRSIWIKAGTKEERIREILKNNKFKYK